MIIESRAAAAAVVNIGVRPTFKAAKLAVEVHILDFSEILYGRTLRAHLHERLRDEQSFDGINELREQIALDVTRTREILNKWGIR